MMLLGLTEMLLGLYALFSFVWNLKKNAQSTCSNLKWIQVQCKDYWFIFCLNQNMFYQNLCWCDQRKACLLFFNIQCITKSSKNVMQPTEYCLVVYISDYLFVRVFFGSSRQWEYFVRHFLSAIVFYLAWFCLIFPCF